MLDDALLDELDELDALLDELDALLDELDALLDELELDALLDELDDELDMSVPELVPMAVPLLPKGRSSPVDEQAAISAMVPRKIPPKIFTFLMFPSALHLLEAYSRWLLQGAVEACSRCQYSSHLVALVQRFSRASFP